jgi:hypothetical protein
MEFDQITCLVAAVSGQGACQDKGFARKRTSFFTPGAGWFSPPF